MWVPKRPTVNWPVKSNPLPFSFCFHCWNPCFSCQLLAIQSQQAEVSGTCSPLCVFCAHCLSTLHIVFCYLFGDQMNAIGVSFVLPLIFKEWMDFILLRIMSVNVLHLPKCRTDFCIQIKHFERSYCTFTKTLCSNCQHMTFMFGMLLQFVF